MATQLRTSRGLYRMVAVGPLEAGPGEIALTAALERADGIERVVLRFRVVRDQPGPPPAAEQLLAQLGPWIEREFEQTREAALKSIRSERKVLEIVFDRERPGPFHP
ncbi:MAG TPA: hypothetical protein VN742_08965 [Candidatus Binataceae bacterium]|nr:hypothetical protein [Candidatus Binataceae bacterium]